MNYLSQPGFEGLSCFQGLEVIEAHYLFGAEYDNIEIVIHPQSIIHSMVETQVKSCIFPPFSYEIMSIM